MIPAPLMDLIVAGVDAMATPDYNFAYGPPDTYPIVDTGAPLVFTESAGETGQPAEGHPVGRYTQDAPTSFRVLVPAPTAPVTVDEQVVKVVNDFKKLLNALEPVLKAAGMQYADFAGDAKQYRLVAAYPAQVTITFTIRYRQLKSAPGG